MSTPSYTVPSTQAITLVLPQPTVGGTVAWSEAPALGTLTPSNDGMSALFTPGSTVLALTKAVQNTTLSLSATTITDAGVYTGAWGGGGANAYVGYVFVVTGAVDSPNNGTFMCTASAAGSITLDNASAQNTSLGPGDDTATAASSSTNAGFIGTITGGAHNALATDSVVVAGFVAHTANNGTKTILASTATAFGAANAGGANETHVATATTSGVTATTVTAVLTPAIATWQPGKLYRLNDEIMALGHVQKVTAGTKLVPSVYTPLAGDIPQGGDSTQTGNQYGGTIVSGTVQFGTVLNQGDGDINGDWPAGAVAANSGNIKTPYPTSAASVGFVQAGYSNGPHSVAGVDGPQEGIDTPLSYSNDSRTQIATYSEIGPNGLISYYDAAGNLHTGWQVAGGTQDFNTTVSVVPPTFSTTGGAVTDGDLTWTDQGAASTTSYAANLTTSPTAFPPAGYFVSLG